MVERVNEVVNSIIRAQKQLAEIKEELNQNAYRPFEQDNIYSRHYQNQPSEERVHKENNVVFITRVLHQTGKGLRDIKGADLLYEIKGRKYVTVQLKQQNVKNLILSDKAQLKNLIAACPVACHGVPPARLNGWCGSWYSVGDNKDSRHYPACEAQEIFGTKKTISRKAFKQGLLENTFVDLFTTCHIGAPTNYNAVRECITQSLKAKQLVFYVQQFGRFGNYSSDKLHDDALLG